MENPGFRKYFLPLLALLGVWAGVRYVLPLVWPFLLGLAFALAAEPAVSLLCRRLKLRRSLGAALGVSLVIVMVLTLTALALTAAVRQLSNLSGVLPSVAASARQGLNTLEGSLLNLANRAPEGMQPVLKRWVLGLFHNTAPWGEALVAQLPGIATSIIGRLPGSTLLAFTATVSAYMISARLPQLRRAAAQRIPQAWQRRASLLLGKTKQCLSSWLTAQAKMCAISFAMLAVGLFILGIPHALLIGLIIALVDALPVLGSGTVLVPWAVVCALQGLGARALGLLAVYLAVTAVRQILEPRLLGKQLGLDPLLTLVVMYAGFRLWGIAGMILSPLAAVIGKEVASGWRQGEA